MVYTVSAVEIVNKISFFYMRTKSIYIYFIVCIKNRVALNRRCICVRRLNKMHAMEGAIENRRNVNTAEDDKSTDTLPSSPKIPQNQQNGAALPEETAAAPATVASHAHPKKETIAKKAEKTKSSRSDAETPDTKNRQLLASTSQEKIKSVVAQQRPTSAEPVEAIKKRKSTNGQLSVVGNPRKKLCVDKREEYILEVVGDDNDTIDELVARANELKAEIFVSARKKKIRNLSQNYLCSAFVRFFFFFANLRCAICRRSRS